MQEYAWVPMLLAVIGAINIIMARQMHSSPRLARVMSIGGIILLLAGSAIVIWIYRF